MGCTVREDYLAPLEEEELPIARSEGVGSNPNTQNIGPNMVNGAVLGVILASNVVIWKSTVSVILCCLVPCKLLEFSHVLAPWFVVFQGLIRC
jgi:uncharacterized membrane protein